MRGSQKVSMWRAIALAASAAGRCANCRAMSLPIRASALVRAFTRGPLGVVRRRSEAEEEYVVGWSCVGLRGLAGLGHRKVAARVGDADLDGCDLVLRAVGGPVGVLGRDDVGA